MKKKQSDKVLENKEKYAGLAFSKDFPVYYLKTDYLYNQKELQYLLGKKSVKVLLIYFFSRAVSGTLHSLVAKIFKSTSMIF